MHKIVRFFRDTAFIAIGIGISIVILFYIDQKTLALYLAHIFMAIFFLPIAYELTGSFNLAFCCNPLLACEKSTGFHKKIKLNSFGKKFFCGYDEKDSLLWLMFLYQCLLLAYICIFIFLNVMFIITLITSTMGAINWIRVWIFEIIALYALFAIVIISSYLKDIYLWTKDKKSKKGTKTKSLLKSDIEQLKYRKIIKQRSEIVTFLKQYGLRTDSHGHYIVPLTNLSKIEKALSKSFPKRYIVFSKSENGNPRFEIYNKKYDCLLIQVKINDK